MRVIIFIKNSQVATMQYLPPEPVTQIILILRVCSHDGFCPHPVHVKKLFHSNFIFQFIWKICGVVHIGNYTTDFFHQGFQICYRKKKEVTRRFLAQNPSGFHVGQPQISPIESRNKAISTTRFIKTASKSRMEGADIRHGFHNGFSTLEDPSYEHTLAHSVKTEVSLC